MRTACQVAIEVSSKSIASKKHVGFAAQAPAQRGMLPATGAGQ